MNNILLIDDDNDFKEAFQIEAQSKNFNLIHQKSFEGLQKIMPQYHHKIVAVVLDIKCLLTDEQSIENEKFIGVATKYLDLNFPRFPRIILTGDDDAFDGYRKYTDGEYIYQKNPKGFNDAFNKLKYFSDNSEILNLKRAHLSVFDLFEKGYYDANTEKSLISVLQNRNELNFQNFGGILRDVRALQETIYKVINEKNKLVVPDNKFKQNGMIKFGQLMNHLNGNPNPGNHPDPLHNPCSNIYHNSAIYYLTNGLYWTSGKYIHADPNESYKISSYTIKSLINNLMELFIWSEQYIKP